MVLVVVLVLVPALPFALVYFRSLPSTGECHAWGRRVRESCSGKVPCCAVL